MSDEYVLPHDLAGEQRRLALMSQLLDPLHRRLLLGLGLRSGWKCLEVGCGNGSMSRWMAHKVGPQGQVIATDVDLRYLKRFRTKNLEVRQQDILKQMPEAGRYDLVTARAVLHHIASPEEAIRNMVYVLKPGGHLLLIEPDFLPTIATPSSLRLFWEGWLEWSRSVGINYFIGRTLPSLLIAASLCDVAAEGTTEFYPGRSPWSKYWLETTSELKPRLLESRHITRAVLARFEGIYSDPKVWTSAITFVASWGTKS